MQPERILFTGGSGLLGSEVKPLLPQAWFPTSSEFNITDYVQMQNYLSDKQIGLLIHAAAFTSPPAVDKEPQRALDVNIIGTANVVKLCLMHNIKLVYISTDYVFNGEQGNYKETDPVYPVNKYAWSKLGGECAVRMDDTALIIRTSFGPNEFPYPKAFIDQWTSRQSVREIATKIVKLIESGGETINGLVHVGGERQTVFDYAKSLDPNKQIGELSIHDMSFKAPEDTSLDCSRYHDILQSNS